MPEVARIWPLGLFEQYFRCFLLVIHKACSGLYKFSNRSHTFTYCKISFHFSKPSFLTIQVNLSKNPKTANYPITSLRLKAIRTFLLKFLGSSQFLCILSIQVLNIIWNLRHFLTGDFGRKFFRARRIRPHNWLNWAKKCDSKGNFET